MAKRGILLSNLGSPDSTSVGDVRKYLNEFLMDERVIDIPYLLRRFIVSAFILPKRPHESAEAYRSIWWESGSPLVVLSQRLRDAVQERVSDPVELAMRYGNPSMEHGVKKLMERCGPELESILFVPLYPHYAMSTIETAVVAAQRAIDRLDPGVRMDVLPPFFDHPRYIDALVDSARPHLEEGYDYLLFSYHGLPERHLRKTDPTGSHCLTAHNCCSMPSGAFKTCYRAQVFRTTEAFVQRAGIPGDKYSVAFQSRLGRDKWLDPSTDAEIQRLAGEGVKKLLVICPAFVSDCLETLEEIGIRGAETFRHAGGLELKQIPCLNENAMWIEALSDWCGQRDESAAVR